MKNSLKTILTIPYVLFTSTVDIAIECWPLAILYILTDGWGWLIFAIAVWIISSRILNQFQVILQIPLAHLITNNPYGIYATCITSWIVTISGISLLWIYRQHGWMYISLLVFLTITSLYFRFHMTITYLSINDSNGQKES